MLKARHAQTGEAMRLEGAYPGEEFFLRELVGAASLLDRNPAATYRSDYRCLATHHPSFGVRMRQTIDERLPALWFRGNGFHWPAGRARRPSQLQAPPIDRSGRNSIGIAPTPHPIDRISPGFHPYFTIFSRIWRDLSLNFFIF